MPYKNNNYQVLLFTKRFLFLHPQRVVSSVGLEHYLDRVGVTGSNPVQPTKPDGKSKKIPLRGILLLYGSIFSGPDL